MRVIYIKSIPEHAFSMTWYYKIIELNKELTQTLVVTKDHIQLNEDEEFFAQVSFIKNKQCDDSSEEISKEEFEEYYTKTLTKINQTISA